MTLYFLIALSKIFVFFGIADLVNDNHDFRIPRSTSTIMSDGTHKAILTHSLTVSHYIMRAVAVASVS
jgi:hypothetical protein